MLTQFAGLEVNVRTGINHTSVCVECACVWVGTHFLWAAQRHARQHKEQSHAHERGEYKCTPQPSRCTASSEGAWGVNIRERRGGGESVRCLFDDDTAHSGQRSTSARASTTREYAWSVRVSGVVLTSCGRQNVTHDKARSDHTHTREGIYECTATAQQAHIQCEGAWGVNIRERGEGWRGVLGVFIRC